MCKDSHKNSVGQPVFKHLFRQVYQMPIAHFEPVLSVSRKEDVRIELFYAFDSTTVTLFADVMKGVGRNLKGDGKKQGGLIVHLLTDENAGTARFATISETKMHDRKFLSKLSLPPDSMVTMDRAYTKRTESKNKSPTVIQLSLF